MLAALMAGLCSPVPCITVFDFVLICLQACCGDVVHEFANGDPQQDVSPSSSSEDFNGTSISQEDSGILRTPQTLQQEFSLININIPNITVEQVHTECLLQQIGLLDYVHKAYMYSSLQKA